MKTLERLAYAKARVVKLDAKMVAHNALIKAMAAAGGPGSQADFDRVMKARGVQQSLRGNAGSRSLRNTR